MEIEIQSTDGARQCTAAPEELITIVPAKAPLSKAPWVYTGSVLMPETKTLIADMDGVLIGFMHTRASLIDYGGRLDGSYGAAVPNTSTVKPGTKVKVAVRARPTGK